MHWINGINQERISLNDRIIHFGDGFFTTARIKHKKIVLLNNHLKRLCISAKILFFHKFDINIIQKEMKIAANKQENGVIKVIISRGINKKHGYCTKYCNKQPTRIISCFSIPSKYEQWKKFGVRLNISPITLSCNPYLSRIKHTNRLEQVLIHIHLENSNFDETIVLNTHGNVIECCSANLFWRIGKHVFTPNLSESGIDGVMRRQVISYLPILGYKCTEVNANIDQMIHSEEIFITNSLIPIAPVKRINKMFYHDRTLYNKIYEKFKIF